MEVKDVRVPEQLMRAMAAEAEAAREARAKVIAAEGEHKASRALRHAAEVGGWWCRGGEDPYRSSKAARWPSSSDTYRHWAQ